MKQRTEHVSLEASAGISGIHMYETTMMGTNMCLFIYMLRLMKTLNLHQGHFMIYLHIACVECQDSNWIRAKDHLCIDITTLHMSNCFPQKD